MYQSLINIGLKKYLDDYFCNKKWHFEQYLENLNLFVAFKDDKQKKILKEKFSKKLNHLSINDHIHELMVACAFHPMGLFQNETTDKSFDLIDNRIQIEIKTINASPNEIERIKTLRLNSFGNSPPEDTEYESRIRKKFKQRIDKAKEQLKNHGIVYLIWDSDFGIGWDDRKKEIAQLLKKLISEEKQFSPNLEIIAVYFEDLRTMVSRPMCLK